MKTGFAAIVCALIAIVSGCGPAPPETPSSPGPELDPVSPAPNPDTDTAEREPAGAAIVGQKLETEGYTYSFIDFQTVSIYGESLNDMFPDGVQSTFTLGTDGAVAVRYSDGAIVVGRFEDGALTPVGAGESAVP